MKETFIQILKDYLQRIDVSKTIVLITICASFLGTNYALVFIEIPEKNTPIFHALVGVIDTSMVGVIGWYFGSSKSSQRKTDIIDKMTDKPAA